MATLLPHTRKAMTSASVCDGAGLILDGDLVVDSGVGIEALLSVPTVRTDSQIILNQYFSEFLNDLIFC